jgi:predicted DNA-binding protein (UPF0251 family)
MVRPRLNRRVNSKFDTVYFKPLGVPMKELESVSLTFDEVEAIRLTDLEEMYQVDAAKSMNVSRQTLGNIVKSAHKKIAKALVKGMAIKIEGGMVEYVNKLFYCRRCAHTFESEKSKDNCPSCSDAGSEILD